MPRCRPRYGDTHHSAAKRDTPGLAEITSALSFALDLTEGAIPGHAVRTTLLGMRIARALDLGSEEQLALYYALQLKDVGCSSNAARMSQIFGGDDRSAKAMTKLSDWSGLASAVKLRGRSTEAWHEFGSAVRMIPLNVRTLWTTVLPGASPKTKLQRILELGRDTEANTRELIRLRCDRGAAILRKIDLSDAACEAVLHADEHWDGSGYPDGLQGESIPLLARIIAVAQNLEVFALAAGTRESLAVLRRRTGTWFDPAITQVVHRLHAEGTLWDDCGPHADAETTRSCVIAEAPGPPARLRADQIDMICEAFADVVDAKSPFTFRHSLGVREVAEALADELQLDPQSRQLVSRAALLHDLGKLGVSNRILDKPGRLTPEEMQIVWQHPTHAHTILARITGFDRIALLAAQHHEKLDGSGYPNGLSAKQLSFESRLLTVADCFSAMIEHRPYRQDASMEAALSILQDEASIKIDPTVVEALEAVVRRWTRQLPSVFARSRELVAS